MKDFLNKLFPGDTDDSNYLNQGIRWVSDLVKGIDSWAMGTIVGNAAFILKSVANFAIWWFETLIGWIKWLVSLI